MILDGNQRRKAIIEYLATKSTPISGTELARHFGVSRQVIVQDVALLRAENRDILSTNKGYLLYHPLDQSLGYTGVVTVKHTGDETLEEMRSVVDYGGRMIDVSIEHDIYGLIRVDLFINNILDAEDFCNKLSISQSKPLKELTGSYHYHTIVAPSEKAFALITEDLRKKGFLIE